MQKKKKKSKKILPDTLGSSDSFPASRTAASQKENYSIDW